MFSSWVFFWGGHKRIHPTQGGLLLKKFEKHCFKQCHTFCKSLSRPKMLTTLAVLKIAWSGCMHACLIQTAVHLHLALYAGLSTDGWETLWRERRDPHLWQRPHVWMQMVEDVEMAAAVDEQRWDDGVGRAGGGGCLLTYKNRSPLGSWVSAQYGAQQSRMRNSTKDPFV